MWIYRQRCCLPQHSPDSPTCSNQRRKEITYSKSTDPQDTRELSDQHSSGSYSEPGTMKETPAKKAFKKQRKSSTWHLHQMRAMPLPSRQHLQFQLQSTRLSFKGYFCRKQELRSQRGKENILVLYSSAAVTRQTMFTRNQRRGSQHDEIANKINGSVLQK